MKEVEIFFKNLFLKWILFRGHRKPGTGFVNLLPGNKVVAIRLNRIGDALVVTPFLHLLKEGTGCKITVIADKNNHFVFKNNPDVDEVIVFEKGKKGTKELLKRINSGGYKCLIDLHDDVSVTVSYIIAHSKVADIIGLRKNNNALYTHTVEKPDPVTHHVIERLLALLAVFKNDKGETPEVVKAHRMKETPQKAEEQQTENGFLREELPYLSGGEIRVRFFPSEKSKETAARKFAEMGFGEFETPQSIQGDKKAGRRFLVGVNISAGSKARFWGVERYKQLLQFLAERKIESLLFCSVADLELAREIAGDERAGELQANLATDLDLAGKVAVERRAKELRANLATDSDLAKETAVDDLAENLQANLQSEKESENLTPKIPREARTQIYVTTDFGEFCEALARVNLLFTPDTATVHLASVNDIPVFGLYVKYNTQDMIWYPYNTRYETIVTTNPTLENVGFNEVIEKFEPFLEQELNRSQHSVSTD